MEGLAGRSMLEYLAACISVQAVSLETLGGEAAGFINSTRFLTTLSIRVWHVVTGTVVRDLIFSSSCPTSYSVIPAHAVYSWQIWTGDMFQSPIATFCPREEVEATVRTVILIQALSVGKVFRSLSACANKVTFVATYKLRTL